jgi:hypothetical protein
VSAVSGKRNKEIEKFFKGMKSASLKGANNCGIRSFIKLETKDKR